MHDHNLDDLIIDNINPKNTKTKSFLTIIALAIIVLIVAIILTKIVLKKPHSELLVREDISEMISPDLTLTQAEEEHVKKPASPKPALTKASIAEPTVAEFTLPTPERIKPNIVAKTEVKTDIEPIKAETPLVKVSDLFNEKNDIHVKNPIVNIPTIEENTDLYYIQVGSFTKTPSKHFLSIIRKSGFEYSITPASQKGTKKLLIGPYKSKSDIDTILGQVKDRINKSAFIVQK